MGEIWKNDKKNFIKNDFMTTSSCQFGLYTKVHNPYSLVVLSPILDL